MAKGNLDNLEILSEFGSVKIMLDPTKRLGISASGKTITVASTHGFTPVQLPDGTTLYISLNAFVYPPKGGK
jgi:hypothetical protein